MSRQDTAPRKTPVPEHTSLEVEATYGPVSLREFGVTLENFTGPFDLLLRLIASREMELTQVSLAAVTDEFLGYIRRSPDLGSATDFLVVAATLLNLKSASLLPGENPEDEADDEDLEARDLLFARLLQYRALQEAGASLQLRWDRHAGARARIVPLQDPYAALLPELRWSVTPEELARLAASALTDRSRPDEAEHVARPSASFDAELAFVKSLVRTKRDTTFAEIVRNASIPAVIVTRFLVVLQLFRKGAVRFEQPDPMGTLSVHWVENSEDEPETSSDNSGESHESSGEADYE